MASDKNLQPKNSVPQNVQEEKITPLTKKQNITIFDFDDTLFPSSFLQIKKIVDKDLNWPRFPENKIISYLGMFTILDQEIVSLLKKAQNAGQVFIVTGATLDWVKIGTSIILPRTYSFIFSLTNNQKNNIQVYSVPDYFDNDSCSCTEFWCSSSQKCDKGTLIHEIIKSRSNLNLIAIGDRDSDRTAISESIQNFSKSWVKSIKFLEQPDLNQLIKEIQIVSSVYTHILSQPVSLEMDLSRVNIDIPDAKSTPSKSKKFSNYLAELELSVLSSKIDNFRISGNTSFEKHSAKYSPSSYDKHFFNYLNQLYKLAISNLNYQQYQLAIEMFNKIEKFLSANNLGPIKKNGHDNSSSTISQEEDSDEFKSQYTFYRAVSYSALKDYEHAANDLITSTLLQKNHPHIEVLSLLEEILFQKLTGSEYSKLYAPAFSLFSSLIKYYQNGSLTGIENGKLLALKIFNMRGLLLAKNGKLNQALDDFYHAINISIKLRRILNNRQSKNLDNYSQYTNNSNYYFDLATKNFLEKKISLLLFETLNNSGSILMTLGNYHAAMVMYDWALSIRPGVSHTLTNRSLCYSILNKINPGLEVPQTNQLKLDTKSMPAASGAPALSSVSAPPSTLVKKLDLNSDEEIAKKRKMIFAFGSAKESFKKGNYPDAIHKLTEIISSFPDFNLIDVYNFRGLSYFHIGNYPAAIDDLKKMVYSSNYKISSSLVYLGRAHMRLANHSNLSPQQKLSSADIPNFESAIAIFNEYLKHHPHNLETRIYRGSAYLSLGKFLEAINEFTQITSLYKKENANTSRSTTSDNDENFNWYVQAIFGKGRAYLSLSNYEAAIASYSWALYLWPNNPITIWNRSTCHLSKKTLNSLSNATDDLNLLMTMTASESTEANDIKARMKEINTLRTSITSSTISAPSAISSSSVSTSSISTSSISSSSVSTSSDSPTLDSASNGTYILMRKEDQIINRQFGIWGKDSSLETPSNFLNCSIRFNKKNSINIDFPEDAVTSSEDCLVTNYLKRNLR